MQIRQNGTANLQCVGIGWQCVGIGKNTCSHTCRKYVFWFKTTLHPVLLFVNGLISVCLFYFASLLLPFLVHSFQRAFPCKRTSLSAIEWCYSSIKWGPCWMLNVLCWQLFVLYFYSRANGDKCFSTFCNSTALCNPLFQIELEPKTIMSTASHKSLS